MTVEPPLRRLLPRLRTIGAAVIGIVLALVALETTARMLYPGSLALSVNDPASGLITLRPGSQFTASTNCYSNQVSVNAQGFYAPQINPVASSGTPRIAVVGNSFVEAEEVPLQDAFSARVGQALSASGTRVNVLPFGVAGNGTYLDALYYDHFAAQFHPNLVIVLATEGNPPKDELTATFPPRFTADGRLVTDLPRAASSPIASWLKNISRQSAFFVQLAGRVTLARLRVAAWFQPASGTASASSPANGDGASAANTISDQTWEVEARVLAAFQRLARSNGSQFMLVSWDSSRVKTSPLGARYAAIAQQLNLPFVDLNAIMGSDDPSATSNLVWSCDNHWNQTGHEVAANALITYLRAHPNLWQTSASAVH